MKAYIDMNRPEKYKKYYEKSLKEYKFYDENEEKNLEYERK
jgi:hypothetical protein